MTKHVAQTFSGREKEVLDDIFDKLKLSYESAINKIIAERDAALDVCRELNGVVRRDLLCEVCLRRLSTVIPLSQALVAPPYPTPEDKG